MYFAYNLQTGIEVKIPLVGGAISNKKIKSEGYFY